jgi:hypothetical protein
VRENTKQVVHVNESSSSWFRGAGSPLVVGAFCEAHFGQQLSVIAEKWHIDQYTEWTVENVEQQFALISPEKKSYLAGIRDSLNEAA